MSTKNLSKTNTKQAPKMIEFALHAVRDANYSFSSYSDENGNPIYLVESMDKDGRERKAFINFPAGVRIIRIPAGRKDRNGKSFADFIRESPYCRGSVLAGDSAGMFYEVDMERDAKVKVEEGKLLASALGKAATLTGIELTNMAALFGCFEDNDDVKIAFVMEIARMKPREFLKNIESGDVIIRATFERCKAKGIIMKDGFDYVINLEGSKRSLNATKDETAITKIAQDEKLLNALKAALLSDDYN